MWRGEEASLAGKEEIICFVLVQRVIYDGSLMNNLLPTYPVAAFGLGLIALIEYVVYDSVNVDSRRHVTPHNRQCASR
jgi:hypothetical protein